MPRSQFWIVALCALLLVPALLSAEVVIRPHDPEIADRPLQQEKRFLTGALPKLDQPSSFLLLPFFEVDTTNASGTTTLFAINNLNNSATNIGIVYFNVAGALSRQDLETLSPLETLSINLRDVAGLPSSGGTARGFVIVGLSGVLSPLEETSIGPKGVTSGTLAGDFFQVDVGGAFATGERLINPDDLCVGQLIRFLDFGSGTKLRLFLNSPQGSDPMSDPPSVSVTPLGEDGGLFPATDIFTSDVVVELEASDFTSLNFGSLVFDFSNSSGGWVYAEYSADGLFSVGLNPVCTLAGGGGPF